MHTLKLSDQELGRLRLLLDSDHRRILRECPEALSVPGTYAAAIAAIRAQIIYLQDRQYCMEIKQ